MKNFILLAGLFMVLLAGCAQISSELTDDQTSTNNSDQNTAIANPASENCVNVGGTWSQADVTIDGEKFGEYGVCEFDDGRLCEEWAMMRGDCPVGGVKVTGYMTEAAKYCAITGGEYKITGMSGETFEQGICTGKTGIECEVWDYYRGACAIN